MLARLSEAEYAEIEAAVTQTGRGRQFLAEYIRRNSPADVRMLLASVERLQGMARADSGPEMARIKRELADVAVALDDLRSELETGTLNAPHVRAAAPQDRDLGVVIERIQDTAWVLREQGFDPRVCDSLDGGVAAVHSAWALQDASRARAATALERLRRRLDSIIALTTPDATVRISVKAEAAEAGDDVATLTIVEALAPIAALNDEEPIAFFT